MHKATMELIACVWLLVAIVFALGRLGGLAIMALAVGVLLWKSGKYL